MPVIAHHIILTGYGHWPPNDPRGSLSRGFRDPALREAGEIHHGRKRVQPSREELREYRRKVEPLLRHPLVWCDGAKRQALADAFGQVLASRRYTCYACAIMSNHAHLLIRRHLDKAEKMIRRFWDAGAVVLRACRDVPDDHPVWALDPYKRFKSTPDEVRQCIQYIHDNPLQVGEPPQDWPFVVPYDGWPHHRQKG
jgi:hypothetical protein